MASVVQIVNKGHTCDGMSVSQSNQSVSQSVSTHLQPPLEHTVEHLGQVARVCRACQMCVDCLMMMGIVSQ